MTVAFAQSVFLIVEAPVTGEAEALGEEVDAATLGERVGLEVGMVEAGPLAEAAALAQAPTGDACPGSC
ncbi:hypothetical protein KZ829_24745 [Actinoplanes hulinensis]|uniref:Uncharacterized protein n=1 Tax=Actinoplanes hulinensis TaxID=1144547 RepID=A0ABS7B8I9_9ACTN|nr:hypothetical protein [Actinoplanes hulinensis]MBW6436956.1 hypothetical protein [Actinoplanes hulinensis]